MHNDQGLARPTLTSAGKVPDVEIARLVLDYVQVLIWPTVLCALVVMFRGQVSGLLQRLVHVEGGGLKAVFEQAQQLAAHANGRAEEDRPRPVPGKPKPSEPELKVFAPKGFSDATDAARAFRDGYHVRLDLRATPDHDAKRIIDLAAGLAFYGAGVIRRIDNRVFLIEQPRQP